MCQSVSGSARPASVMRAASSGGRPVAVCGMLTSSGVDPRVRVEDGHGWRVPASGAISTKVSGWKPLK